jgi:iron complex outermembrane receptor protein
MNKVQTRTAGRTEHAIGMLSLSRTTLEGFRQFSQADVRDLNGAVDYFLGERSKLELRANIAAVPLAKNPGALTQAEWDANPDSAAATNVARGASREVAQHQYSLGWRHTAAASGDGVRVIAWHLTRTVDNALATPPPPPAAAANGTYNNIQRMLSGVRVDGTRTLGGGGSAPRLTAGIDAVRSRDNRRNWRSTGGRPTAAVDTLLQDQTEIVSSVGPFAQLSWAPRPALQTSVGVRYDVQRFEVDDHFTGDGDDDSGIRTMSAASGHVGASYSLRPWLVPYANVATAFETPTTTELNSRPDGAGGFNPDLNPQRIVTVEAGARGAKGRWTYDVSAFRSHTRDAIIQYQSIDGRSLFQNAGSTNSTGVEIGVQASVLSWLDAQIAYTLSHYVFGEYRIPHPAAPTDTLDGNRLAGVPNQFVRAGLRSVCGKFAFDVDWTWGDKLFADDLNTLSIPDWGRGRFDARFSWAGTIAGQRAAPFVAVNNAFDQKYVGSVTLNGTFNRVRESAPGRNWYAGLELGWSVLK